jgi:hypothetical protein
MALTLEMTRLEDYLARVLGEPVEVLALRSRTSRIWPVPGSGSCAGWAGTS